MQLMILEVSKKQDYIFASQQIRENAMRSDEIRYVTSDDFFRRTAGPLYCARDNLVYSGGGHTIVQFENAEAATDFAKAVTAAVLRQYNGLELFVCQRTYDPARDPGENLRALIAALERKKARRRASFRRVSFGVEALDPKSFEPVCTAEKHEIPSFSGLEPAGDEKYAWDLNQLTLKTTSQKEDNFLSVIHIDGNAMGSRVGRIYEENRDSWERCRSALDAFSRAIQADFEASFREMRDELLRKDPGLVLTRDGNRILPLRPVILAGDDVCFVTRGKLGLECAGIFLEKLCTKTNAVDHRPYSACAGVAIVHSKYPFHQAYDLAEELCSSAKEFGSSKDPQRRISAIDWHIEFGQLKGGLREIRSDYETEDGSRLELRPLTVVIPDGVRTDEEMKLRSYQTFRRSFRHLTDVTGRRTQTGDSQIARWKIKELRTAMKQGSVETQYFLEHCEIPQLASALRDFAKAGRQPQMFVRMGGQSRSCLFDAIELLDHCVLLAEQE